MTTKKQRLLQLPRGANALYLEDAEYHQALVRDLGRLWSDWGYLPVQTPVFDFYDIYRPLLDRQAQEKVFRMVDRDGDLLMLRSDITLFLAKQVSGLLSTQDLPLRVWYADAIMRYQNREDISKNEFFQAGIELIGKPGLFADMEVLMLLHRALGRLGLEQARVHLGSRGLFQAQFGQLDEELIVELKSALNLRDRQAFEGTLSGWGMASEAAGCLGGLFFHIGGFADAAGLGREGRRLGVLTHQAEAELAYLEKIGAELASLGARDGFRLDLSEIGGQPYYTGIVFQAFADGFDSAIASGGRYDNLLARFGCEAPSVGFSLMLSKIHKRPGAEAGARRSEARRVGGAGFAEAFSAAEGEHAAGRSALLEG